MESHSIQMPTDRRKRMQITLSPFAERILTLWGKLHDKPASTYAGAIIESRCEVNAELVMRLVAQEAEARGMTTDDLVKEWLDSEDGED